jgi:hypothetical protein
MTPGIDNLKELHLILPEKTPAGNSTCKKLAVHWFNEALCFVSSSVVANSSVFRNRQLHVAVER